MTAQKRVALRIMGAEKVHVRYGSQRWRMERAKGIGASEIAAVIGTEDAFDSPTSLYHKKIGDLPPIDDNEAMEWGRRHERAILDKFLEDRTIHSVERGPMYRSTLPGYEWQFATPDALGLEDDDLVVIEVKTSSRIEEWGPDCSDDIPLRYRCQVMQQMDIVGARRAYVPVLFNGRHYREYLVTYNESEAFILREQGKKFWARVLNEDPPPPDGHSATSQVLREMFDVEPQVVDVPRDLVEKFQRARALSARMDRITARYENELRLAMGDASKALCGLTTVATRAEWTQDSFDTKRFREEHPEIYAAYAKPSQRSRLTFRGLKS